MLCRYLYGFLCSLFFCSTYAQNGSLWPVKINHKWGYINEYGKIIIQPVYEYADDFTDSLFAVTIKDGKAGLLDKKGNIIIKHQYDEITFLEQGIFAIKKDSLQGLANTKGNILYDCQADDIFSLPENYFLIQKGDKYGVLSIEGKLIIPIEYDSILYITKNVFQVQFNDKYGLVDSFGKNIINTNYDNIYYPFNENEDVIYFSSGKKWGFKTLDGKLCSDTLWTTCKRIGENFILCSINEEHCLYSLSTQKNRKDSLSNDVTILSGRYLKINYKDKYEVIDSTCKIILHPNYDDIELISDNIFSILKNGKWAITDASGKNTTKFSYDEVFPYDSFFCLVISNNNWGIIDKTPKEVAKPIYTKIEQLEKVFKLFEKKGNLNILYYDKKGNITDYESFKNVETIKIGEQRSQDKVLMSTTNVTPLSTIYNKYGWYQDSISRKWGLKDSLGAWKIKPMFKNIKVFDSLGLTKVTYARKNEYCSILNETFSVDYTFGMVNHTTKKILLQPDYLSIEMENFIPGNENVVRFTETDGNWGLVTQSGKIVLKNATYIGPFLCGYARVFEKGKLVGKEEAKQYQDSYTFDSHNNYIHQISENISPVFSYKKRESLSCIKGDWYFIKPDGTKAIFDSVSNFSYVNDFIENTSIAQQGNKFGLLSIKKIAVPFEYFRIGYLLNTKNKLLLIEKANPRYSFINRKGNIITPFQYQSAKDYKDGFSAVLKGGRWGFIDTLGKEVCKFQYSKTNDFYNGMAAVYKKGKWGFIDETGEEIISCKYRMVGKFSEDLCPINENGKWGFIDKTGTIKIKCEYNLCEPFHKGYAIVSTKNGMGMINMKGELIIACKYQSLSSVDEYGFLIASKDNKAGLINIKGDKIAPFHYLSITPFKNGFAVVNNEDGYGFIDSLGNISIKPQYFLARNFSDGLAAIEKKGKWSFINKNGQDVFKSEFTKTKDFLGGFAMVTIKGKSSLIDKSGHYLIPYSSSTINSFTDDGFALIKKRRKSYFIDKSGKNIINKWFDDAKDFNEGLALVCEKGKWGLINKFGLFAVTYKYEWAKGFKEGFSIVRKNSMFGVCNSEGKFIVDPIYDFVKYTNNQIFRVENNEKIGYLKSSSAGWIWNPSE